MYVSRIFIYKKENNMESMLRMLCRNGEKIYTPPVHYHNYQFKGTRENVEMTANNDVFLFFFFYLFFLPRYIFSICGIQRIWIFTINRAEGNTEVMVWVIIDYYYDDDDGRAKGLEKGCAGVTHGCWLTLVRSPWWSYMRNPTV